MHKLIVDTNVLVSSLLGKSYPHRIVNELILGNKVLLFVSGTILDEYKGVLARKKFNAKPGFEPSARNLLESIDDLAIIIKPEVSLNILSDASDNKFLELSITSQAEFLVTGNTKHFPFRQFENTQILSPKEYWEKHWK